MDVNRQIRYWAHMLDECRLDEASVQTVSVRKSDIPSLTRQELAELERKYGVTDDFQESGWLLPDGKLLQMHRNEECWWDADYNKLDKNGKVMDDWERIEHECLEFPDSYLKRVGDLAKYGLLTAQQIVSAGFIRLNVDSSPVIVNAYVKPTPAQMDRLYDLADMEYSTMYDSYNHKTGLDQFYLELPGKFIEYDNEDEFKKRFLNDIRNAF